MELCEAVKFGMLQDVAKELRGGADPNTPDHLGYFPLRLAVNNGDIQKVKLLLDAGAIVDMSDPDGNSAICEAIMKNRRDMIRLLLDHQANISGTCSCGGLIAIAALGNNGELVDMLASMGADVNVYNQDGFTPLMLAAANNAKDVIPILISHGARLEIRDKNEGLTAYLHAALAGDKAAARILLKAGANPYALSDDGKTAPMLAVENGHQWDEFAER